MGKNLEKRKKEDMRIKICVVGWYYLEKIYEQLSRSKFDIHIVAHCYNKILDKLKLKYTLIENIGLEYGAYDWYIKNIWSSKNQDDVFFMHDDIEILDFDNFIYSNYCKIKKREISYEIFGKKGNMGQRFFYMSFKMIRIIKKENNGIWYDKENFGYNSRHSLPQHWYPGRHNDGARIFGELIKKIKRKYNIKIFVANIDSRLIMYDRGRKVILHKLNKKERKKEEKDINVRKKRRKKLEKEWKKRYEDN